MSDPIWLTQAITYKGFHEVGENRGIEQFISLAGAGSLGDPWCAIFTNAMLQSVGVHGTRSAAARSFSHSEFMRQISEPIRGCIVVLWRGSPNGELGHVGFFLDKDSQGILMLSGNDDDQVEEKHHPADRLIGYYWPTTAPMLPPAPPFTPALDSGGRTLDANINEIHSGKGSWYSQFHGRDIWVDPGDGRWNENKTVYLGPDNALGVPDEAQGIAFLDHTTLGHWFEVNHEGDEGWYLAIQSDIGPGKRTQRLIDISAALADRMGFTHKNFPTDGIFRWRKANPPPGMENLSPQQQAIQFAQVGGRPPVIEQPTQGPPTFPPPAIQRPSLDPQQISDMFTLGMKLLQRLEDKQTAPPPPPPPQPEAKVMGAGLAIFLPWLITVLPQISLILAPVVQALVSGGIMGPVIGANATATGQTVGMTLLSTFGVGIANWVKAKWFTPKKGGTNVTTGNGKDNGA